MFIGVPLLWRRSSRARISEETNAESEMSKEFRISQIFGSSDGVSGFYTPYGYSWSIMEPRDMDSYGCGLTP